MDWIRRKIKRAELILKSSFSFLFKNSTDGQTVAKNTVWLSISNICGRLLKAVVIIYAVRVLDPSGWGVFSYAVTLAGFFTFFADPGVNIILIREGSKKDDEHAMELLSTTFYIKLLLILVTVLFVLLIGPYFSTLPGAKVLLPIAALIIVGDTLREFFSSYIRAKEKMEREAAIFLTTNLCIVVFGFVALSFLPTALSFGWAYAAGTTVGALLALWVLRSHIKELFSEFSAKLVGPILRSAWPFAITGALGLFLTNMDILIISWLRTASDVGVYSAAVRMIQVLYLLPVIIQYSTLPFLSRLVKQNSEKFRAALEQIVALIFAFSIPIALGGAILGTEIMQTVFGAAYAVGGLSLTLLMLSMLVDYPGGVISLAIFAYDRQKILIYASIIGGAANVLFDLLLIPHYGIAGSAFATLIAQILNNGYLWYAMKKVNYFEILPRLKKIITAGVLMAVVTALLLALRTNVILNIVLSTVVYVVLLLILREPLLGDIAKLTKISDQTGPASAENANANNTLLMKSAIPSVHIGKTVIPVEVVQDISSIREGLSHRGSLDPDHGMLFLFPRPKKYRFWMRNMSFPIDIIWIRGDRVVGITENARNEFDPSSPRFYKAPEKADHVIEVNAGFTRKEKIRAGDKVSYHRVQRQFEIIQAQQTVSEKELWNEFLEKNQPIVGAFLESWEWGAFQKNLGMDTKYYFVKEKKENAKDAENPIVAIFILTFHHLPLGLCYGYIPRGPVIAKECLNKEMKYFEIMKAIQGWAKRELRSLIFLRMEPSIGSLSEDSAYYGFRKPSYNIQPPHNTLIPLSGTEQEILARFHSSTRSNIKRAERRGATVEIKKDFTEEDFQYFFSMIRSTIKRNNGKKAYPSEQYLRKLVTTNYIIGPNDSYSMPGLSLAILCGYQYGKPATTHIVVFCGTTATYLFGASHTEHLSSKIDTYLHWVGLLEAKKRGMHYYDIGGIDENIWPSLTKFKRQFGGDEISYVGNIDIPIKPILYRAYNVYRRTLKKIHKQI